ncbi:MAG TPA: N-acetylmuramoyl-L-alanine amidase [Planctomycetaceae bacterium]|nr:N-acetylmuramoyl-L-alanine amidase [Planctomycetaceae bacterium]
MNPDDIAEAQQYNAEQEGSLWNAQGFVWPFSVGANDPCFTGHVAVFQRAHGLKIDGKLGPNTLATMNAAGLVDKTSANRAQPSNRLIIGGVSEDAPTALVDAGYSISNFVDDGVQRFTARARTREPSHVVLHESVTLDVASTVRVLQRRSLGVHLMVAPDGSITNHNDLVLDQPAHANQVNSSSIGIEIINPYSPIYARPPFNRFIAAKWWTWVPKGSPRQYVLPTPEQMGSLELLVEWLTDLLPEVPLEFPTLELDHRQRKIDGWRVGAKPPAGIVAHRDFASHADARWPLEFLAAELSRDF